MKILLSNKFYYRRGGDCVCTINLEELLKRKGHEVAIFAMQYPDNIETPWSKYFPGEVKFKPGLGMLEALLRPFGTFEVKKKLERISINPATQQRMLIPPKLVLTYKPSVTLKEKFK